MDGLIQTIGSALGVAPITSAASIVTGADTELTNVLLQQLAIALVRFSGQLVEVTTPVILSQVEISVSVDGSVWFGTHRYQLSTSSADDVQEVELSDGPTDANFIKIIPLDWSKKGDRIGPAVRVNVNILSAKSSSLNLSEPLTHGTHHN